MRCNIQRKEPNLHACLACISKCIYRILQERPSATRHNASMHSTQCPAACVLQAAACNTQHHHLTQVSACHKRSKIGAIMKRKLGIHSMHPYHDSTLIKVMMANGQQLQPMHALFLHAFLLHALGWVYYLSLSSPLLVWWSWGQVKAGEQQHMYTHITFRSEPNKPPNISIHLHITDNIWPMRDH